MRKIKILYFETYADIAGGQKGLLDLLDALDRDRFDPVVVCPREGPLSQALSERNLPVQFVDIRKREQSFYTPPLFGFRRLLKFIRAESIDIIHANNYYDSVYTGLLSKLAKLPSVCTVRNVYLGIRLPYIRHNVLCALNSVVCTNCLRAGKVISNYVKRNNIRTIYTGIDLEKFNPQNVDPLKIRNELNIPSDVTVISQISQLNPQKGHIHIINAAAEIIKQEGKVHFLFVGGGFGSNNNKNFLEEEIGRKGLTKWFTFTGFRNDIEKVLSATDITVLSSVMGEGLPRIILESMAMQRPVVASDLAGTKEIIDDGRNGYIVAPEDESEMTDRLLELIKNVEKRKAMGLTARAKIEKTFDIRVMVDKYQNLYEELTGQSRFQSKSYEFEVAHREA